MTNSSSTGSPCAGRSLGGGSRVAASLSFGVGALSVAWMGTISVACGVVVCSRELVTSIADMEHGVVVFVGSKFVCVEDRVLVEVGDFREVNGDVLIVDLTECSQLDLSGIGTWTRHGGKIVLIRVF